jgi:hypothetical protein
VIELVDYDELAAAHLLGAQRRHGLAIVYIRAIALGGSTGALHIQIVDAADLLEHIQLGDGTLLGLIGPRSIIVGDAPPEAVLAAPLDHQIAELEVDSSHYQVQALPLRGVADLQIGRVVMARPGDTTLSLFPHAQLVLAVTLIAAIAAALATSFRARQLSAS